MVEETFRKKPLELKAFRYTEDNWHELSEWTRSHGVRIGLGIDGSATIPSRVGTINAQPGDYVFQVGEGEFYAFPEEVFEAIYDKVESSND